MVTNGGYGGVQQALAHGVPLVVAGASEDKPEVAARVAWSGAGLDLRTGRPSEENLRAGVQAVLGNPSYREHARRLREAYLRTDAGTRSADLIERLASTRATGNRPDWYPARSTEMKDATMTSSTDDLQHRHRPPSQGHLCPRHPDHG